MLKRFVWRVATIPRVRLMSTSQQEPEIPDEKMDMMKIKLSDFNRFIQQGEY